MATDLMTGPKIACIGECMIELNQIDLVQGAAIASMPIPKPRARKSPTTPPAPTSSSNISGMPQATSISTSQADFDRLKSQGSQSPIAPL
jgi:hypothetical protein